MEYLYIEERKCWSCGFTKNRVEFSKDSYDDYGLQKACKTCQKKKSKEYNDAHKEYFRQKNKEKYNKADNPARYQKHREVNLKRRNQYSSTVRGRFTTLLYSAKTRADKKNLTYTLDADWLFEQYETQDKCCKLTGFELDFVHVKGKGRKFNPFSPSLDRIDRTKGYTKDNVRLVCTMVNLAINHFGEDIFRQMCEAYLSFTNKVTGKPLVAEIKEEQKVLKIAWAKDINGKDKGLLYSTDEPEGIPISIKAAEVLLKNGATLK